MKKIFFSVVVLFVFLIIMVNIFFITARTEEKKEEKSEEIIGIDEAKNIALKSVQGKIKDIDLVEKEGRIIYEIEIMKGIEEFEVLINSENGVIMGIEKEETDDVLKKGDLMRVDGLISEENAKEIALERFGGRVIDFKSEREHGKIIYEVGIRREGEHIEVEINAQTGEIIEVEYGDDD
jgi:uncharacterized membrane protein YkoI